MRIICSSCKHEWDENIDAGQQVVMCPECMNVIPTALIKFQNKESDNSKDIHSEKTIVEKPDSSQSNINLDKTIKLDSPAAADSSDSTRIIPKTQTQNPGTVSSDNTAKTFVEDKKDDLQKDYEKTKTFKSPSDYDSPKQKSEEDKPDANPPAKPSPEYHKLLGKNLGGCILEKLLGAGGMGAVYLAHQISLDRKVAVKILPAHLAENPDFIARFTREALSAAQLNHHNVIQIFDVGNEGNLHYMIMEFVKGQSLGDIIRESGRLRIDDAAGYILQASRGLKYAHERGIIHRDIKPDNLMINEHGIIKIADMGLAKWRKIQESSQKIDKEKERILKLENNSELTMQNIALGTPAYMSPEQAQDASSVDSRADQYSLGCTLYYLCAGKAPYSGTTVFELISKHINEPLTPLDVHVHGVPASFERILKKLMAKRADDRYLEMGDFIKEVESYLGIDAEKGPFTPREHHLKTLEEEQKKYYSAASLKRRKLAKLGFYILMPILIIASLFSGNFPLVGGFVGLLFLTPLANFILTKDSLFRRCKNVFFGMPLKSWIFFGINSAIAAGVLIFLGWLPYWIGFAVVSFGLALLYQMFVLRPLKKERSQSILEIQGMLKEFRIKGLSEDALQDFICRFSGTDWEEFFEDLFGYEEMIVARGKWARADKINPRKKYGVWRDPLYRWLEGIEQARKEAKEKKQLVKSEANLLKSKGMNEEQAYKEAEATATRIIKQGFIKRAPIEKKDIVVPKRKNVGAPSFSIIFKIINAIIALAVIGAAGSKVLPKFNINALDAVSGYIPKFYYDLGIGGSEIALGAGLILLIMTFSSKFFFRLIVLAGVLLLIASTPIIGIVNQPHLNPTTAFFGGIILVVGGFIMAILSKLGGNDF